MAGEHRFNKHYTRDEARQLLPEIQTWIQRLVILRDRLEKAATRLERLMADGLDRGGDAVEEYLQIQTGAMEVLNEFEKREILVKDLDRGLIDFPAIIGGREVFLCWEHGDEDIEFWHDLDSGYAGRERL